MNISKTVSTVTNKFLGTIENIKNADSKRNLKIKDIILIPEFKMLLQMDSSVVESMTESMKTEGFKPGHEIHIWIRNGQYVLIDGHTRLKVWSSLGNTTIPCIIHHFENQEEARNFALAEQKNRRNMSQDALLQAIAAYDFTKGKGNTSGEKGKASEIIGKKLGVSAKTVEKARVVLREATDEQKEAISKNELSINKVYEQIRKSPAEPVSSSADSKIQISAASKKVSKPTSKETAFLQGIHYAITRFHAGATIADLVTESSDGCNVSVMMASLNGIDFSKLLNSSNV